MMDPKMTPLGQTIAQLAALGPVANTDTKLLIYQLLQKGRVLAQDGTFRIGQAQATLDLISKNSILGHKRPVVQEQFFIHGS